MSEKLYVITVWEDVSPEIEGPFANEDEQLRFARAWHGSNRGSTFRLDVDSDGLPEVWAFSGEEIPGEMMIW